MSEQPQTTGWQPIETAPKDGRKFILWDGWQQCLASYEKGKYLATQGQAQDNRRPSKPSMWHPMPEDPK